MKHECHNPIYPFYKERRFAWRGDMSARTIQLGRKGYGIGLDPDAVVIAAKTRLRVLIDTRSLG